MVGGVLEGDTGCLEPKDAVDVIAVVELVLLKVDADSPRHRAHHAGKMPRRGRSGMCWRQFERQSLR
jgi:hypothetical protein